MYSVNVSVDHQLHYIKIPCTWKLRIPSGKKQHKSLKYKDWMKKYHFGNCNVISCNERFEQLKNKLSTNKCTCVNFSTNQGKEHLTSTYSLICLPGYSPKKRKKMYCAIINWSYYLLKLISHSIAFLPNALTYWQLEENMPISWIRCLALLNRLCKLSVYSVKGTLKGILFLGISNYLIEKLSLLHLAQHLHKLQPQGISKMNSQGLKAETRQKVPSASHCRHQCTNYCSSRRRKLN